MQSQPMPFDISSTRLQALTPSSRTRRLRVRAVIRSLISKTFIDRGDLPYSKDKLEGRFFNSVDSVNEVDRVWPQYLATRPDFVKLVFVFSEFYSAGKGKNLGLLPEVAKEIVRKAKLAGLRSG